MASDGPRSLPRPIPANAALLNFPHLTEKDPGLMITPEKSTSPKKIISEKTTSSKLPSGVLTQSGPNQQPLVPEVGPEKVGVLKQSGLTQEPLLPVGSEQVDLIPTRLSSIVNDPTLDVTPEKTPTVLKKGQSSSTDKLEDPKATNKNSRILRVRFDVPESLHESEESLTSDFMPLDRSPENTEPSQQEKVLQEPFSKRAALYAQRNPLADITPDSSSMQETSENSTGSETLISTDSDNSSGSFFNKIAQFIDRNDSKVADMHGKIIRGDSGAMRQHPTVRLKTVQKPTIKQPAKVTKTKITNITPEENRLPPRSAIDQVTRPKSRAKPLEQMGDKKSYLKKKSGLHRHEHSIRYDPEPPENENQLSGPAYNSTLTLGQELQELKVTEFDAQEAVRKKMDESERLRNYITEKTAEATNINPDEILYQNLVKVDVEPEDLVAANSVKWKRTKPKPYKPKKSKHGVPDIWETYNPEELYYSDPMLNLETLRPRKPSLEPVPLEQIMWADKHEQLWNGAWGWKL